MLGSATLKLVLLGGAALAGASPGIAQVSDPQSTTPPAATPTGAATPAEGADLTGEADGAGDIVVTGSRIKRDPNESPLPLQIITTQEIQRNGISSPEQLLQFLTTNGNGGDNLASNADVVTGQQRGNNGASFANLRNQGSGATLILLNGRRVAAHGLQGSAVDVNQIPFSAIERVEVLKEGASAIYGTDAIGGVINFILRKDYRGVGLSGFADIAERGDHTIYRTSAIAGLGDLGRQGFNIMGAVSYATSPELRGDQRDFVDTFQPERGLSVDTRGTPHATIVPLGVGPNTPRGTIIGSAGAAPFVPGSTTVRTGGGINILDLPGGERCASFDGQEPYDTQLWNLPTAEFACAWDTGRAAVLQQPLETLTYLARAVARLGEHELSAEVTGSDATAKKRFSNVQITPNTTTQNYAHPSGGVNYDTVFNRLVATFPTLASQRGLPISYRYRCVECNVREITTDTQTFRAALGAEGPLFAGFDYRAGASYATSESESKLGSGFYYRGTLANGAPDPTVVIAPGASAPGLIGLLNSGIYNPFLLPGQTQSQAALDALAVTSAEGVVLYGGKYTLTQVDGSVSGPLFRLPGGMVRAAAGVDYRREKYRFNGDVREAAARPFIIAAPFDDTNALAGVSRDIKAAYAEVLIPIVASLEITAAVRADDYSGFGTTVNPLVAFKFRPIEPLMFRGNYNTGFRAPTFNQIFNGQAENLYTGRDLADPRTCPGGVPSTAAGCAVLDRTVNIINGGNPNIGPETAKQYSLGVVFQPARLFSASVDFFSINRENTIQVLTLRQLVDNFALFEDRFIRDAGGNLIQIDQTFANAGSSRTQGLEVAVRGGVPVGPGQLSAGLDGTYLIKRREKVVDGAEFGPSQIGVFTFSGDLNLRWKHNAFVGYRNDDFGIIFTQLFRNGYRNQQLPGVANGTIDPPNDVDRVKNYVTYNLSVNVRATEGLRLTAGVKNLFDTDPPFAVTYDSNTGSGSSWEPRVADPRGRAFTILADVRF